MPNANTVYESVQGWEGLLGSGFFEADQEALYRDILHRYPFKSTGYYLSLASPDDPADPILRQVLPDPAEICDEDFPEDPFDERVLSPANHLIQRFENRALLRVTDQCAVRCRHCTRKNLLDCRKTNTSKDELRPALKHLKATPAIREVLISGGDPLLVDLGLLDWLLWSLGRIDHVEVLRIGTRLPVVLPSWIDADLCQVLEQHRPIWVNTQFNHPRELTPESMNACSNLVERGIPVSNQAVFLKGVNDSVDVMRELCNGLQRNMIRPYYVFQCDPVRGISHLRVPVSRARLIADTLRQELGGLALPRFVADIPGVAGKTDL